MMYYLIIENESQVCEKAFPPTEHGKERMLNLSREDFQERLNTHCNSTTCDACCFRDIPEDCWHLPVIFENCLKSFYKEAV